MTRYSIVSHRSRVAVEVQSTLQRLELVSSDVKGDVELELHDGKLVPAGLTASLSVPSSSLGSGTWLVDRDVRMMFESRKYPEIAGQVIEVKTADGGGNYWVRGNLRLHGVTREVSGQASVVEISDHHAVFEGAMTLDYTQFNLTPPKLLMLKVEPEVVIRGRVYAESRA
jgi:polyisoprenoid-binding protein YceI